MNLEKFEKHMAEFSSDHVDGHTDYQIDNFIVGSNGKSDYAKYRQALREVFGRWRLLQRAYLDIQIAEVGLEVLDEKFEETHIQSEKKKNRLEYKLALMDIDEKREAAENQFREFRRFFFICRDLKKKIGDMNREDREKEYWIDRLGDELKMECLLHGRPSKGLVQSIMQMPVSDRNELAESVDSNVAGLIKSLAGEPQIKA